MAKWRATGSSIASFLHCERNGDHDGVIGPSPAAKASLKIAPSPKAVSLLQVNSHARNSTPHTDQVLLFESLKARVQDGLLEKMDLSKLDEIDYGSVLSEITKVINGLIVADRILITDSDRSSLIEATINDILGLGPLEPLLQDNEISDILVNGPENVWVERKGILDRTEIQFRNELHLLNIINRIVSRVGRRIG